jgi:Zn-finger protein
MIEKQSPALRYKAGDFLTDEKWKFFSHKECEFYPCHTIHNDEMNCKFCYCPLFPLNCGGEFIILSNGVKDCSGCSYPHEKSNHDELLRKLNGN